jgi:DNA-binding transcriptional MerR regulator
MFIGEAEKLSGATQRAIRLYESLGLLSVSRSGNYRVYNKANIELIKIIKEAQTLGIHLSEMVALKGQQEEFDWRSVNDFLIQKYSMIEDQIKQLEVQKARIESYRVSINKCVKELDSNL